MIVRIFFVVWFACIQRVKVIELQIVPVYLDEGSTGVAFGLYKPIMRISLVSLLTGIWTYIVVCDKDFIVFSNRAAIWLWVVLCIWEFLSGGALVNKIGWYTSIVGIYGSKKV